MRKRIPQGSAHQLLCLTLLPSPSQLLHRLGTRLPQGRWCLQALAQLGHMP